MKTKLTGFLERLEEARIHHELCRNRDDAISVLVVVPGQRWEVDFLDDGSVDVERFVSNGEIRGEESFDELFEKFADRAPNVKVAAKRVIQKSMGSSTKAQSKGRAPRKVERHGVLKNGH